MPTSPQNLLFIFSDEHRHDVLGCAGDPVVQTPNLDALAVRGTRFTNAYTPSPLCMPARASLATGRFVHQTRCWDNAHPYHGVPRGWGHRLIDDGHAVVATGKLHMRSDIDDNGHSLEIETLHAVEGIGNPMDAFRDEVIERPSVPKLAGDAGPGWSTYAKYDIKVTDHAIGWMQTQAPKHKDKPWVLYVGYANPHFPFICPPEFYEMYDGVELPMPRLRQPHERPTHTAIKTFVRAMPYDKHFDDIKLRKAIQAYYGMVTFMDHQVGRLVKALEQSGLSDSTRILYSSDHGDNLGTRGLWGKSVMYEESVAIPMILTGKNVPRSETVKTPVSLVDVYPTIIENCGMSKEVSESRLPGRSLFDIMAGADHDRAVFSEYHSVGSTGGSYMVRWNRWKYVFYNVAPPQLFNLEADPGETTDLAGISEYAEIQADLHEKLLQIVDPEDINTEAFNDQHAKIESLGGAEAVKRRGDFVHSPVPGENVRFFSHEDPS